MGSDKVVVAGVIGVVAALGYSLTWWVARETQPKPGTRRPVRAPYSG